MKASAFLIYIAFWSCSNTAVAQQDSLKLKNYFLGTGIIAGMGNHKGIYVGANVQVQQLTSYLSARISSFLIFNPLDNSPAPNISEASLLFGKSYTFQKLQNLQLGMGLGIVTVIADGAWKPCDNCGIFDSHHETIRVRTIGVPVEIKYNFYSSKRKGALSFSLNTNLNRYKSFYGVGVGLISGKLRPRIGRQQAGQPNTKRAEKH